MKGTEAYEAIVLGLGAVQYMAARLESSRRTFDLIKRVGSQASDAQGTFDEILANDERVLRELAEKVNDAMNLVGDFLNNVDATDEDDEDATDHAFRFMRRFLSGAVETDALTTEQP